MKTEHLITLAIVIAGVIIAAYVSKKMGLNSYEEYETFDSFDSVDYFEVKKAA